MIMFVWGEGRRMKGSFWRRGSYSIIGIEAIVMDWREGFYDEEDGDGKGGY